MPSTQRGLLAILAGFILGMAFVEPLHSQLVQVGLVVVAAVLAGLAALSSRRLAFTSVWITSRRVSLVAVGFGMLVFVANLQGLVLSSSVTESAMYVVGILVLAGCGLAFVQSGGRKSFWVGFVVAYSALTVALIVDVIPFGNFTDVQLFQHEAARALARGVNPFAMTFVDIYPPHASAQFYAEGVSVDGVLQFGYPYFPLGLLIITPFELLGDYRFGHAAAVLGAAVLMSRMTANHHSTVVAILFLLISPSMAATRNGWSDPLVLLALVAVVAVAQWRGPNTRSVAAGFLFAVKQYTVFLVVPSLLLLERPWSIKGVARHLAIAGGVVMMITLPFVLWSPSAFWTSVVELQFLQPFRPDSVALPALASTWWPSLPALVSVGSPFLAVAAVSVVVAVKTPTGGQGFALGSAFVLLIAFLFSKQAFVNYYLVAVGALFAAAATAHATEDDRSLGDYSSSRTTAG